MKLKLLSIAAIFLGGLVWAGVAAEGKGPETGYPLKTCVVSDEPLGSMGDAYRYVHKEAGKPDRTVFFCCEGCVDDFKKEPAKYLKKIDDAAKEAAAAARKGASR